MVNKHPCGLHLKSCCAQEHTIAKSFSMPSFLLFGKEKDAYKHQKGGKTWGAMQTPSLTCLTQQEVSTLHQCWAVLLILDQTPTGGSDMVYRHT